MDDLLREAPSAPRLCHIKKLYASQQYGFELHVKNIKDHFIGKVYANSPADIAGLKSGDRIIAVNGALIANESDNQVGSNKRFAFRKPSVQIRIIILIRIIEFCSLLFLAFYFSSAQIVAPLNPIPLGKPNYQM
jgi:hypothetical protein